MKRALIIGLIFLTTMTLSQSAGYNGELIAEGKTLTVDFKDAELLDVIRIIARKFDLNMIAGDSVKGKVTVSFREVPVDDALESILKINGFSYQKEGNIVRVIPARDADKSEKKNDTQEKIVYKSYKLKNIKAEIAAETIKKIIKNGDKIVIDGYNNKLSCALLENEIYFIDQMIQDVDSGAAKVTEEDVTEIIRVKYMSVDELAKILSDINLNFTGAIKVNTELKSLVVRGKKGEIEKLKKIVDRFDVEPLQVLIEARIVELTDEDCIRNKKIPAILKVLRDNNL